MPDPKEISRTWELGRCVLHPVHHASRHHYRPSCCSSRRPGPAPHNPHRQSRSVSWRLRALTAAGLAQWHVPPPSLNKQMSIRISRAFPTELCNSGHVWAPQHPKKAKDSGAEACFRRHQIHLQSRDIMTHHLGSVSALQPHQQYFPLHWGCSLFPDFGAHHPNYPSRPRHSNQLPRRRRRSLANQPA